MKKQTITGWVYRKLKLKYKRDYFMGGDKFDLNIWRGNPNPGNYTETNNWEKVRITIEEL